MTEAAISPVYYCRTCDEWLFPSTDLEERANVHTNQAHSFAVVPKSEIELTLVLRDNMTPQIDKVIKVLARLEQRTAERIEYARSPRFQFWMACTEFRYQVITALRIREALDWLTSKLSKIRRTR